MQENYSSNNPYVKGFDIVSVGMGKTQYKSFTVRHCVDSPVVIIIKSLTSKSIYYAGVSCNKYKQLVKHIKFSEYPENFHVHVFEDNTIGVVGLPTDEYCIWCFNAVALDWMFQQYMQNKLKGWTHKDKPEVTVGYPPSGWWKQERTEKGIVWTKAEPTTNTSKFFNTVRVAPCKTTKDHSLDEHEAYHKGILEGIRLSKLGK